MSRVTNVHAMSQGGGLTKTKAQAIAMVSCKSSSNKGYEANSVNYYPRAEPIDISYLSLDTSRTQNLQHDFITIPHRSKHLLPCTTAWWPFKDAATFFLACLYISSVLPGHYTLPPVFSDSLSDANLHNPLAQIVKAIPVFRIRTRTMLLETPFCKPIRNSINVISPFRRLDTNDTAGAEQQSFPLTK